MINGLWALVFGLRFSPKTKNQKPKTKMQAFKKHTGKTVAIFLPNIDTDQILPKQFLKCITKSGYGDFLFYDWRFDEKEAKKQILF